MKIGFSSLDITPTAGTPLSGQPFVVRSAGIMDPLSVRAVCLDDGTTAVIVLSCDVLLIPNALAENVRAGVERAIGVPADHVVCCTTHTHSGPGTEPILGSDADEEYVERLRGAMIDAAVRAHGNRVDGKLLAADCRFPGFAFSRRFLMSDGTVETHPLKGDPHIVEAEGPDSTALSVLYAVASDGTPLGAAVGFGCHATVMERNNDRITADYPGAVCRSVSAALGGDAVTLFLQGAAGDVCQVDPRNISRREVGREWVEEMGGALGRRAVELIRDRPAETGGPLRVITRTIRIPRRAVDPALLSWARRHRPSGAELPTLSDYGVERFGTTAYPLVSLEELFKTRYWADFYAAEILRLEEARSREPELPLKITVAALDGWAMIALPCELFVEWGEEIRRRSSYAHTTVVTLAGGWCGYIPTRKAFERPGGYETKEVTSTMLIPEAGEMLLETVIEMLRKTERARGEEDTAGTGKGERTK